MHWREMQSYVGWTEEDGGRLQALHPHVEPHSKDMIDAFYEAILQHEGARSVMSGPEQVDRLKVTLRKWLDELLTGPWDEAYWARRARIGWRHVQVGLPHRYVFTAMNLIRSDLVDLALRNLPDQHFHATCRSIGRITDIELAVMSGSFMTVQRQEELRTLQGLIVRNMPVTVLCLNGDGRITSATRVLGQAAELGMHFNEVLPPELVERAELTEGIARARATGNEVTVPRLVLGGGASARHFRLTLVPLEHELAAVLLHLEELTDVVQAESRAAQAESLARIGSLAANIAHEIRNPLAAISATLQVIGASLSDDDRRRAILKKVQGQVLRLDDLVSDLLGYARPAEPHLEEIEISQLVREAVAISAVSAQVEQLSEGVVVADAQHAQQILVNLLQNGQAAGEPVSIRVDGPCVIVQDSGAGIDPEVRETLFDPFVTTKTRGTGLGLAICRKLARGMGAEVDLLGESPTRFALSLRPARAFPTGSGAGTG